MEQTTMGHNLTGAGRAPADTAAMVDAAAQLTPFAIIDVSGMEDIRLKCIDEAAAVGFVPLPVTLKGVVKSSLAKLTGSMPSILLDKMGERLAYERAGVRLYDALILKFEAARRDDADVLPDVVVEASAQGTHAPEDAPAVLRRIRAEELRHFHLLVASMEKMGGDPTCQTPCADVTALASSGFMQVLNDPRTTLAQCLNAMLSVELADNAGWELLADLADDAGESTLASRFLGALAQEQ